MRSALTPLAAYVLLLLITVSSTIVLCQLLLNSYTNSAFGIEALKVEAVAVEDGELKVYVRNVGSVNTTVASIYVVDADGVVEEHEVHVTILPKEIAMVSVPNKGAVCKVSIRTIRGSKFEYSINACA